MPRGKEQKYLSKDVNKWKLEFQVSVWGVCKANISGACWKHSPAHVLYTCRTDLLASRAALQSWGMLASPLGRESLGVAIPNGSAGWSWEGSTLRSFVSVSLCGNTYLTWQALPSLT